MFALAVKNILFYKSRSITTFVLVFISTFFFIVYVSLMNGAHSAILENALKVYTGAIEIYKKGYREKGGNEYLIRDVKTIEDVLQNIKGIHSYSARYESYGLIAYKDYSSGVMIVGIDPQKEQKNSSIKEALRAGEYLSEHPSNCLYMGSNLAKRLHLKLHDRVSFIGSASDDSFVADIFRLCGEFTTGDYEFDSSAAFVNRRYLDKLMLSENMASYIAIRVNKLSQVERIQHEIEQKIQNDKYEVVSWKTLMKSMVEAMKVDSIFGYISISLFFVVIFFVIMIFGFINVSARLHEFGVLRSIGLSRTDIRALLFWEIFVLASSAVVLATPLGAFVAYYYSVHPIVIEGISQTYKEYGIVSDTINLSFDLFTIGWNVGVIYLLSFLSIIYPVHYINKFTPIEALRHV